MDYPSIASRDEWLAGKSCSHLIDAILGGIAHLAARDAAFVVVSRAPLAKIEPFKRRMGWTFPWLSAVGGDFNHDVHVTTDEAAGSAEYNYASMAALKQAGKIWMEELPGLSVFLRDGNSVFHTCSAYSRGLDSVLNTYNYLDMTPLGRQEEGLPWAQAWVRRHDQYSA